MHPVVLEASAILCTFPCASTQELHEVQVTKKIGVAVRGKQQRWLLRVSLSRYFTFLFGPTISICTNACSNDVLPVRRSSCIAFPITPALPRLAWVARRIGVRSGRFGRCPEGVAYACPITNFRPLAFQERPHYVGVLFLRDRGGDFFSEDVPMTKTSTIFVKTAL